MEDNEISIPLETESSELEITTETNLLDFTPNAYVNYFKQTDNSVGFHSLKAHAFAEYSDTREQNLTSELLSRISVNGQRLEEHKSTGLKASRKPLDVYGKTIEIILPNKTTGKSSSEEVAEMYIPKKLNVTKPLPQNSDKITMIAYYKDFRLEWNADPKNKEGLMVAVEFRGENVNSEKNSLVHVQNIDHIEEDNGTFVLDDSMFDGIPNLSFVDIILLRGNVRIDDFGGETVKTYAESHQRIPILLVKDLSTIRTLE